MTMSKTLTRTADAKGRIALPARFAKATVLIEEVSDTELRVRKAKIVPEDEVVFMEAKASKLIYELLSNPPKPSPRLRRLMQSKKLKNGKLAN
jgi:DNA-binding transcriptional regulator/RsmH inhibitor MraZ